MTVLLQMLDHFRSLARETEEEIKMIEAGKLSIIRNGQDYFLIRLEELRLRLAKLADAVGKFG